MLRKWQIFLFLIRVVVGILHLDTFRPNDELPERTIKVLSLRETQFVGPYSAKVA